MVIDWMWGIEYAKFSKIMPGSLSEVLRSNGYLSKQTILVSKVE